MSSSPKSPKSSVSQRKYQEDLERARTEGLEEGLQKGRVEIIDFLEQRYLKDESRPDRGTPGAEAILALAREAHEHFMRKITGPRAQLKKKGRN